jgi:hypothetical protein
MVIEELISYCGLTCKTCPIFWATKEEDKEIQKRMRIKIAQISNEMYKTNYTWEDITDCDGCRSESGRLFSGCYNCEIRKCVREKSFITCGHCPDYVCNKLQVLYDTDKDAKILLDIIRSVIQQSN